MIHSEIIVIKLLLPELCKGILLATGFGAVCGAVFGSEVAEHWYGLYKMDKKQANLRFLYWWEDKTLGLLSISMRACVCLSNSFLK
jgi:hypothetical protein